MGKVPTKDSVLDLSAEINGSGQIDILHVLDQSQTVVGWIDSGAFPQGTLAASPSTTTISVNGVPVTNPNFIAGANVTLPVAGSNVTVNSTGGGGGGGSLSVNGTPINNPNLTNGTNTTLVVSGSNVAINSAGAPGSTNVPWADIQAYGGNPHRFAFNQPTAGATTSAGLPNVTLSTSGGAPLYQSLKNGQGICIWEAGNPTTQSTPAAPVGATAPQVTGTQSITYAIVGYDKFGGLTAISPSTVCTSAPNVFSPLPVTITSISATGGLVTANFSAPLNNTVSAGMTIHIVGVTGAGVGWNGVWILAGAASTQSVTFNIVGASGTGTVSASSTGRLSNTQPITAISRDVNGIVTVTTAQPHNFNITGSAFTPTVVIIENCTPVSLNGYFTISSVISATTFTVKTGIINNSLTGSIVAGSSTATVWEFIVVACPQLSGTTNGYYVYSDSPSPGNGLVLIGKVPLGDCNFTDWGQCFIAGYRAPGYVPTTPPASSQNQYFTSTINSGGGTPNIILNNNVPTTITGLGATLMYDDGPNLIAAMAAASGNQAIAGSVIISCPTSNADFSGYIFNSSITIPQNINVTIAAECIINETWTFQAFNQINVQFGTSSVATPAFATQNFLNINGIANPFFLLGGITATGNLGGIVVDGLCFTLNSNGQTAIIDTCFFTTIKNCGFKSGLALANQGNMMAIIYLGSSSLSEAEDLNWALANRFYGNGVSGQSPFGPAQLPAIWFRGSTNTLLPNYNDNTAQFTFKGKHSANARGIALDHQYSQGNGNQPQFTVKDAIWLQQGTTPIISLIGDIFHGIEIHNILNDTSIAPILANLGSSTSDVYIYNCSVGSGYSVVCGNPITNLFASGNAVQNQSQLQRVAAVSFTSTNAQVDIVNLPNCVPSSLVTLTPTNLSATLDMAAGNAYIYSVNAGNVVVAHSFTSGMTFNVYATVGD